MCLAWKVRSKFGIVFVNVFCYHAFVLTHIGGIILADFPVMPCEVTGFTLKPDGFFAGNPAIDLPPDTNKESKLNVGCCSK